MKKVFSGVMVATLIFATACNEQSKDNNTQTQRQLPPAPMAKKYHFKLLNTEILV